MSESLLDTLLEGPLRLSGTVITGTIPVSEAVLTQLAGQGGQVSHIKILEGNNLEVALAGIPYTVNATIVSIDASLDVTIKLNGLIARVAIGVVSAFLSRLLPDGVRSGNGRIHVSLKALPQLSKYRFALKHLRSVSVATQKGILYVTFKVAIE